MKLVVHISPLLYNVYTPAIFAGRAVNDRIMYARNGNLPYSRPIRAAVISSDHFCRVYYDYKVRVAACQIETPIIATVTRCFTKYASYTRRFSRTGNV